jgi:hypothetical protein
MEKKTAEKEVERNEEMEEDDVEGDVEHEGQLEIPEDSEKDGKKKGKGKKSGRTSLSGRGVTLKMLLDDGVLTVEEGCMSIDYLVSMTVAVGLQAAHVKVNTHAGLSDQVQMF